MTPKEIVTKLINSLPSVVLHFHVQLGEKSRIYEEHGTLTDALMREFLIQRVLDGEELDWETFNLTPNTTTFKAHMLAFEDEMPDGSVKIREVQVPTTHLRDIWQHDLEQVWQWGQNDFQPQQCCSLSVGDVVEYDDKLYVAASFGWREISQDDYATLVKMDRRDRQFSEIVRPKDDVA